MYERAAQLHAQGYSVAVTARLTGIGRTTLQGWFKTDHFPERATRPSCISPFVDVVRDWMATTEYTGQRIYDELVGRGYTGSRNTVYDALEWLRQGHLPPAAADQQVGKRPQLRQRTNHSQRNEDPGGSFRPLRS